TNDLNVFRKIARAEGAEEVAEQWRGGRGEGTNVAGGVVGCIYDIAPAGAPRGGSRAIPRRPVGIWEKDPDQVTGISAAKAAGTRGAGAASEAELGVLSCGRGRIPPRQGGNAGIDARPPARIVNGVEHWRPGIEDVG